MTRFEAEPRVLKPEGFDEWTRLLAIEADYEGVWSLIGLWMAADVDCCAYLVTVPGLWAELLTRARYADLSRYTEGILIGRRA